MKGRLIGIEAGVLLVLGTANLVTGRFLGAAIIIGLASLAAACAWALWPAAGRIMGLAGEQPRRAGWSRRRRH